MSAAHEHIIAQRRWNWFFLRLNILEAVASIRVLEEKCFFFASERSTLAIVTHYQSRVKRSAESYLPAVHLWVFSAEVARFSRLQEK
jgi:hypothetical protein